MKFAIFWEKKKMFVIGQVFVKLLPLNYVLVKWITRLLSENPLAVNVLTSPKNSLNLQKSNFIELFSSVSQINLEKVIFNQI